MARPATQEEFAPEAPAAVLARMRQIAQAGDGWINFLPGVPGDVADELPRPSVFSALFGTAQVPVSMCTWMPAKKGRPGATATIGIMHPRGRGAAAQLDDLGVPVPVGWTVGQDHPRRGLLVHPPVGTSEDDILRWLVAAGAALAMVPLTGLWKADIHLPRT